jgi:radical SAM protein with 4Fe4S-binding SPASM domain
MKNLHTLLSIREEYPDIDMKVSLQIIRMDETETEIEEFKASWSDRVDEISIPNVHNWGGVFEEAGPLRGQELERFPCRELWRTMMVFCDGSTSICCAVFDNNMNMGNAKDKSLREIWTSPEYQRLRKLHLDGKYDQIDICKDCNMWKVQG